MKKLVMVVMLVLILGSLYFAGLGIKMHKQVFVEEDKFHALQEDYFGGNSKAQRDAAFANTDLTGKLVEIQNYPSELLRLKLVGVGKILTGIYLLLLGILIALMMMPHRLGMIIKGKK